MLLDANKSLLLLVDVQEKLMPLIHQNDGILASQIWLTELANALKIPVALSEQYPKGLGHTLPALADVAKKNPDYFHFEKREFSCTHKKIFQNHLKENQRTQIVVAGIESHVCVLQTAIELRGMDLSVFVIADAIGSRNEYDKELAILRMIPHGIQVLTREMVFFEWMRTSEHPQFKELSKKFMQ